MGNVNHALPSPDAFIFFAAEEKILLLKCDCCGRGVIFHIFESFFMATVGLLGDRILYQYRIIMYLCTVV